MLFELEYNFEYEQSYINAFKREFGITPGDFRKSGHIVKVIPPLFLFNKNKLADGLFFGPDIVMVPQFHVVGKNNRIVIDDAKSIIPKLGSNFWDNEHKIIKNAINPNVYNGILYNFDSEKRIMM